MRKVIYVAELIATGKVGWYGRFFRPYVTINSPEDDELNVVLDEINSEIIISFPFKYREATSLIDIPIFKVTMYDEDNEVIDELQTAVPPKDYESMIEFFEETDTYARWNFFDSEFRIRLNPKDIPVGTGVDPKKYIFHVQVTLRRWIRPALEEYPFGAPPEDFPHNVEDPISFDAWAPREISSKRISKTVTLYLKALTFKPGIYIDSIWPLDGLEYGDYRFYLHDANYNYNWGLARRDAPFAPLDMVHTRDEEETIFGLQPYEFLNKKHTIKVKWNESYSLNFLIRNLTDINVNGWRLKLLDFSSIDGQKVKDYFEGKIDTFPLPSDFQTYEYNATTSFHFITPNHSYLYSTDPSFIQKWKWFDLKELEWWQFITPDIPEEFISGSVPWSGVTSSSDHYKLYDTTKSFHYLTSEITIFTEDGDIIISHPEEKAFGHFIVEVPREKVSALWEWAEKIDADRDTKANMVWFDIIMFVAGFFTHGATWAIDVISVSMTVVHYLSHESYNHLLVKAVDPVEIDINYMEVQQFEPLIQEPTEVQNIPDFLTRFVRLQTDIVAIHKAIEITFNRFMTALLYKDDQSINQQKEQSEYLIYLVEKRILLLNSNLPYVCKMIDGYCENIDEDSINDILEKLREEGLPNGYAEKKREEGFTEKDVEIMQSVVKTLTFDKLFNTQFYERIREDPLKIYNISTDAYIGMLEKVKKIKRITLLAECDVLKELLKEGLINKEEYIRKLENSDKNQSYPLDEVNFIDTMNKISLMKENILSTMQLLKKSTTEYQREKLAKKLGLDQDTILKWANYSDLMRVYDLSEYYAIILEHIGVDTAVELSRRNPTNLYEKLSMFIQQSFVKGSVSRDMVFNWIQSAKIMKRMIEY